MIIGHLDEDGYLKPDLEELRESAASTIEDVEIEEVQTVLRHVHNLEPTGVGARDVAECLELQLKAMPDETRAATPRSSSSQAPRRPRGARLQPAEAPARVSEDDLRDVAR